MIYLEFISMARILLELEPWNMLLLQREGNRVLKEEDNLLLAIGQSK